MSDDTFTASDFSSAASAGGSSAPSEPVTSETSSAPVETAAQPGEATTPPAATTDPVLSTDPTQPEPGPMPFKAHKTALENARVKAVQEAQAKWDQDYGWARQIPQTEIQSMRQIANHFASGDVEQGLNSLLDNLRKDPAAASVLARIHAKGLAAQRQPKPASPPVDVQPMQFQLDNGQQVGLYTAEQMAAREAQLLAKMEEKFQPVIQTAETWRAQREQAIQQQQVTQFAASTYDDVKTWAGMDNPEHQQMVAQALAQAQINPNDPRDILLAMERAYRTHVLPRLQTTQRQAVLNDINRQAAASTVNPARTSTRTPKTMDDMSIAEALQFVAAQGR